MEDIVQKSPTTPTFYNRQYSDTHNKNMGRELHGFVYTVKLLFLSLLFISRYNKPSISIIIYSDLTKLFQIINGKRFYLQEQQLLYMKLWSSHSP